MFPRFSVSKMEKDRNILPHLGTNPQHFFDYSLFAIEFWQCFQKCRKCIQREGIIFRSSELFNLRRSIIIFSSWILMQQILDWKEITAYATRAIHFVGKLFHFTGPILFVQFHVNFFHFCFIFFLTLIEFFINHYCRFILVLKRCIKFLLFFLFLGAHSCTWAFPFLSVSWNRDSSLVM